MAAGFVEAASGCLTSSWSGLSGPIRLDALLERRGASGPTRDCWSIDAVAAVAGGYYGYIRSATVRMAGLCLGNGCKPCIGISLGTELVALRSRCDSGDNCYKLGFLIWLVPMIALSM